jgi:hypothetical protein
VCTCCCRRNPDAYLCCCDEHGRPDGPAGTRADRDCVAGAGSTRADDIPTTAPVEPTVAPTAATVSCAAEAAPFKAQVLAVRSAYRPLVDQVYRYTLELVDAEFDASRVDRAFADIESIPIPECVDVGEVIYYFRLMRDTLSPAYIEMNIESNGHYPSPESFTRVKGWYAEIKSFDENIDAILATIPTE